MDAKAHPVVAVLGDARRFTVPIYQRQYAWDHRLLKQFWDDVVAKAEEALSGKPKFEHYMGALIIAPGADGYKVGTTPKVQVVDGQQRLTTFQLFLAALRRVARHFDRADIAASLESYVFNVPKAGEPPEARFKLVPTPNDRVIFHELMTEEWETIRAKYPDWFYKKGTLIWGNAPKAVRAFAQLSLWIEDYARSGIRDEEDQVGQDGEDSVDLQHSRLQALAEAVLQHLKLVVITLEEGDDAQVIFETLNSKSEPLLAMDLVRNNIFHRASAKGESAEVLFQEKWSRFDDLFWKEDAPRAKPKRPRIDHFLSHALTAMTGQETSLRELYAEYRAFTRPKGNPRFNTVEEELEALVRFAPIYRRLEEPDGSPLGWLGSKLAVWEVAVIYPVVLQIALAEGIEDEERHELYRLLYSYVVRRAVCDLTAKGLNKNFERLASTFLEFGVSRKTFSDFFLPQTAGTIRFPSNEEFTAAILGQPVYEKMGRKERIVDLLWELELATRSKFQVNETRPAFLSIEHVMPRSWRDHWPLTHGQAAPAQPEADETATWEAAAKRDTIIHTLGNLTLVTTPLNSSLSNGPFTHKRGPLKDALLAMNIEIAGQEQWDEDAIRQRGKALAARAVTIWPEPKA